MTLLVTGRNSLSSVNDLSESALPDLTVQQRRIVYAIAFAALLLRLIFWTSTGRTWEDALISVLHSENCASGLGLTHYHPGQSPVHGFTSPLSVLIPLAADLIHVGWGLNFLKLLSALVVFPTIVLAAAIASHGPFRVHPWLVYLLCGYLAFEHQQILWGMAGMETQVAVFIVFLTLYCALFGNAVSVGIAMALAIYARPDFVLFLIPVALYLLIAKRAMLIKSVVLAVQLYAPWIVFTSFYYGSPIPNTIIAKRLGYTDWTANAKIFSHDFWTNTWSRIGHTIFLPMGPYFGGHGGPQTLADHGAISQVCLALIVLGTIALAFRFRSFYIIPIGNLVIWCMYYTYFVPIVFGWYLSPFSALNCLLLVLGLGALFDIMLPAGWVPAASQVVCVAYLLPFLITTPVTFKAEKDIQTYVENPVRKAMGEYLFVHKKPGETVGLEPLGYVSYYSRMPVYDYPGLASKEVVRFMSERPGNLKLMLEHFKPDWIALRPNEWKVYFEGLPLDRNMIASSYQVEKVFRADPRAAEILRGDTNVDICFYLFRKRSPADQVRESTLVRTGPEMTGGEAAITGHWTTNGFFPNISPSPVPGAIYGSWSGSDANTGSLRLGPYTVHQTNIQIPVVTGPSAAGVSLKVLDAKTGKELASLNPFSTHTEWWIWNVALPQDADATVQIVAEDAGTGWGQWLAIGVPHHISSGLGQELSGGAVAMQGSWTKDGYPPSAPRPLIKGITYGSWSNGDAQTGTLRLGPYAAKQQRAIGIPLITGSNEEGNLGLSVKVLNAKTGKVIARLDPPPMRSEWWAWTVPLPDEPDLTVTVVAEDAGSGQGQWLSIGVPRMQP